jgi:hypothetical protein
MKLSKKKQKKFHKNGIGEIRVITTLPNSEQSYKGKVKTYKYINRQNQSTTGKKVIRLCSMSGTRLVICEKEYGIDICLNTSFYLNDSLNT